MRFPHKPGTNTHCSLFIISKMTRSRHDMNMLSRLEQARIHTYTGIYKYTKNIGHTEIACVTLRVTANTQVRTRRDTQA